MHKKLHAVGPLAANYQACSIVLVRIPADSPLRNALEKSDSEGEGPPSYIDVQNGR